MTGFIPSIVPAAFPQPRRPRKEERSDFAAWLGRAPMSNSNDVTPLLSLEDELLLARMRENARRARLDAYAAQRHQHHVQYEFPFMLEHTDSGKRIDRMI